MQKISHQMIGQLKSELLNPNTSYTSDEFLKIHLDNFESIKLLSENTKSEIFTRFPAPEPNHSQPTKKVIFKDSPFNLNQEKKVQSSTSKFGEANIAPKIKEEIKKPLPVPQKYQKESKYSTVKVIPSQRIDENFIKPAKTLKFENKIIEEEQKSEKKTDQIIPEKTSPKPGPELKQPSRRKKKVKDKIKKISPSSLQNPASVNIQSSNEYSQISEFNPRDMSYENLTLLNSEDYNPGKGFSFEVLSNLNQFIFKRVSEEPHLCNICQEALEPGQNVSLLKCSHIFHYDCIYNWISRKKKCAFYCELEESDFLYD